MNFRTSISAWEIISLLTCMLWSSCSVKKELTAATNIDNIWYAKDSSNPLLRMSGDNIVYSLEQNPFLIKISQEFIEFMPGFYSFNDYKLKFLGFRVPNTLDSILFPIDPAQPPRQYYEMAKVSDSLIYLRNNLTTIALSRIKIKRYPIPALDSIVATSKGWGDKYSVKMDLTNKFLLIKDLGYKRTVNKLSLHDEVKNAVLERLSWIDIANLEYVKIDSSVHDSRYFQLEFYGREITKNFSFGEAESTVNLKLLMTLFDVIGTQQLVDEDDFFVNPDK